MTSTATLVATLHALADLVEIRGSRPDASDLRRAIDTIHSLGPGGPATVSALARQNRLADLPVILPAVHWRIREVVHSPADALAAATSGLPELVRRLLELGLLTTESALILVRDLEIATLADLEIAHSDGRIVRSFGDALQQRLVTASEALREVAQALTLGRAWEVVEGLLALVAGGCPLVSDLLPAGDMRRFEPIVSGLVLVGRAPDPEAAIDQICALSQLTDVRHRARRRAIVAYRSTEIDIRIAEPTAYGTLIFDATGSVAHLAAVAARYPRRVDEHPPAIRSSVGPCAHEQEVYERAGLQFVPPEIRHATGEIEAAAAGALPELVSRRDIVGDLHMHSTYSDGRDTVERMVETCHALGYAYIAITDHSERAAASRTLSRAEIGRQRDEIAGLRERYPTMAILHGVEVDIMPDGRLDFDDELLEQFDIVLASLHDSAGQDRARLTKRCIDAIRHPLVSVLTHPSNRIVGHRPGYNLDYDAVYAAAVDAGTALEIDGGPGHLDLDGEHARAAIAAGVVVTIDSDCHRAQSLERQMQLGLGTARRGWVEPRHVLNTRPIEHVLRFIAAKRSRGRG